MQQEQQPPMPMPLIINHPYHQHSPQPAPVTQAAGATIPTTSGGNDVDMLDIPADMNNMGSNNSRDASPRVPTIHFPETILEVSETASTDTYSLFDTSSVVLQPGVGLTVPPPETTFNDWSSLAATVVDDSFWMANANGHTPEGLMVNAGH
jgi:hypothetical protein